MGRPLSQPTTIGPSQSLVPGTGPYQGPRVWLLGRENLINTDNFETQSLGEWNAGGGASLSVRYDSASLHGRYVLRIDDNSGLTAQNGKCVATAGTGSSSIFERTFFVAFHVNRLNVGSMSNTSRVVIHQMSGETETTALYNLNTDGRGWFWWVVQLTNLNWQNETTFELRVYPFNDDAETGAIEIVGIRIHRVFAELTNWPLSPLVELTINPRVFSDGGPGLGFGVSAPVQDGVTFDIEGSYPYVDIEHAKDLVSLAGHRGYVLVQPEAGGDVAILTTPEPAPLAPRYAPFGQMKGYGLSVRLVGAEPYYCAPSGQAWRDSVSGGDELTQKWVQGVTQ